MAPSPVSARAAKRRTWRRGLSARRQSAIHRQTRRGRGRSDGRSRARTLRRRGLRPRRRRPYRHRRLPRRTRRRAHDGLRPLRLARPRRRRTRPGLARRLLRLSTFPATRSCARRSMPAALRAAGSRRTAHRRPLLLERDPRLRPGALSRTAPRRFVRRSSSRTRTSNGFSAARSEGCEWVLKRGSLGAPLRRGRRSPPRPPTSSTRRAQATRLRPATSSAARNWRSLPQHAASRN